MQKNGTRFMIGVQHRQRRHMQLAMANPILATTRMARGHAPGCWFAALCALQSNIRERPQAPPFRIIFFTFPIFS